METLRILPFDDTVIDDAASLLAARQQRDRQYEPALPERFVETSWARAALLAAWQEADASGVVALRDRRIVGFLIGAPEVAEIWGRSVWMRFGGHALASKEDADLYRHLYAAAAPRWLARGCFAHYVEISADDRAGLDSWFRLSFGLQQAYGMCSLPADNLPGLPSPPQETALTIRRAGPDDRDTLVEMRGILWAHLGRSPIYSVRLPEDTHRWQDAAVEALADSQVVVWLAEQDAVALGAVEIRLLRSGDNQLDSPEECCYFAFAATREEARGRGISTMLTTHALREAHTAGYVTSLTDWRVTNMQASHLWPYLGFRPFKYRLHRLLDDRITTAPSFPE